MKLNSHEFRSNTLPAAITVIPAVAWLAFFVAIPLVYVLVMSFCSLDEYYNVAFQFTLGNYADLLYPNYVQIYAQSIVIAALSTAICLALGYPFAYLISRTFREHKVILYMPSDANGDEEPFIDGTWKMVCDNYLMYTMTEVRRYLRVGMGLCQGQSCTKLVKRIM